jgi:hypothetical protein
VTCFQGVSESRSGPNVAGPYYLDIIAWRGRNKSSLSFACPGNTTKWPIKAYLLLDLHPDFATLSEKLKTDPIWSMFLA